MTKSFNIAGPIKKKIHYFLPQRLDTETIQEYIALHTYFILHAPRQTGKTTAILSFVEQLREEGDYLPLYVNVESAQAARGNVTLGIPAVISRFYLEIESQYGPEDPALKLFDKLTANAFNMLEDFLRKWAQIAPKPLVIFIDEIDSLVGDTLISVLRQLRTGYVNRPDAFPQSICLIGVRDVRDYRIFSEEEQAVILGGSAFNIKAESFVLENFSPDEVEVLYRQHTEETGQKFTDEAIAFAYEQTCGQPWLVNALAFHACFRIHKDRAIPITKEILQEVSDTLIARRDTHLDVLLERLKEERVANIIDALISGRRKGKPFSPDDLQYTLDLGLVREVNGVIAIANPIYQEIIPRALTYGRQARITENQASYLKANGTIDMEKLLTEFTQFYRENASISKEEMLYKESGPHLLLMAYLQRIINGGGRIHREYALGRGRVDLFIQFHNESFVLELKIYRGPQTVQEGLKQTVEYMHTQGASEGHLILFDRSDKSWEEKIYTKKDPATNITMWGV